MKRRPLGRSGRDISAIGLGCMGMSEFYGPTDDEQSLDTLAAALDLGIDFLDTADAYGIGRNEELVGRFLRGRRDRVVLATKFAIVRDAKTGSRRIDNSPAYVRQACDASLKRLGIETIDLYYCHRRDPAVPVEDMVGAMAELRRRQGPLSRPVGGLACDLAPRPRRPSHHGAAKRIFPLVARA